MAFGDVIRYAASPGGNPSGLGGKANIIWHCDASEDKVYELSISDLSVIRSAASPGTFPNGIGGTTTKIWHCDASGDCKVYELSTSDLSVVRSAEPVFYPDSIGGGNDKIWNLAWDEAYEVYTVHELSTSDFSVVRTGTPPTEGSCKIGGDASIIWLSSISSAKVYELLTTDFSVDKSADSPTNNPTGIGGDPNTLWYLHNKPFPVTQPDRVYELDYGAPPQPPIAPTELLCNGQTNPIDVAPQYFSAIYNDPNSGDIADYYRLQVNKSSDFTGQMLWDSGKMAMSDVTEGQRCSNLNYNGQALSLNKIQYFWRIKFWDDEGNEGAWSAIGATHFTMAGSGTGEMGAGPWEEDVLEPTGEAKVEIPRRSGQWTTLDDVMRIHTSVNKNPLDAIEIAQAEVTCSNIDKHFNSFEEASDWYKSLEGYAVQLSVGCKVGGTPISEKLFTGIISSVGAVRLSRIAEIRVVDFLDYFGRVTIEATPIWQNISLTQLYKNLVELAFSEWVEGIDYFVEDLGDITVPAVCYEKLNLLSELKHIAECRGMRIFTDVNGKLVCRSRNLEGEPWDIKYDYNLEDVQERRDINKVYNWIIVHARPHEIGYEPTSETPGTVEPGVPVLGPDVTPPGKIAGFTATPKDQGYDLTWSNPWNADFELVRILSNSSASTGAQYPLFPEYKAPTYEGTGESFSKGSIANGQRIFFSAFTKDTTGNWSEAAHASCVVGAGGGQWEDNTGTSSVSAFRAEPESGRIILTWRNPSVANFDKVVVRRSTTSYPTTPTSGTSSKL